MQTVEHLHPFLADPTYTGERNIYFEIACQKLGSTISKMPMWNLGRQLGAGTNNCGRSR
jgi:hypothetical protein